MIKNERQYAVTMAQAERFRQVLDQLAARPGALGRLVQAERDALRSQLADLQTELAEYEALRSGEGPLPALPALEDLPRALIQARITRGLSQKELAQRLGLKEQQVQRYEATDYRSVSLQRLRAIVTALTTDSLEGTGATAADG